MEKFKLCNDSTVHDAHEWIDVALRENCPGKPTPVRACINPESHEEHVWEFHYFKRTSHRLCFGVASVPKEEDKEEDEAYKFAKRYHDLVEKAYEENPAAYYSIWDWEEIPEPHRQNIITAARRFLEEK